MENKGIPCNQFEKISNLSQVNREFKSWIIGEYLKNKKVSSVRVVLNSGTVNTQLVYTSNNKTLQPLVNYVVGVDLGLNNFLALVSPNPNQWFNKKLSQLYVGKRALEYKKEIKRSLNDSFST